MKRKVIKQGHNTLTITIPTDWAKRLNLEAGSELELSEEKDKLIISKEKKSEEKRAEFDITGMDLPTIWKHFVSVYREGYDEVTVKFTPGEILQSPYKYFSKHKFPSKHYPVGEAASAGTVGGFTKRFIGFEIVEEGKDFIKIKDMGKASSKEFDNALKKLFWIVQNMTEETFRALKTKNSKIGNEMHEADISFYKFQDYCIRILNKTGNKNPQKSSLLYATMFFLKLITNDIKHIAHYIPLLKKKQISNKVEKLAEIVEERLNNFRELFYNYDKKNTKNPAKVDDLIYSNIDKFYEGTTGIEKEIIFHLRMIETNVSALFMIRVEMEFSEN